MSPKAQWHYGSEKYTQLTLKHSATITCLLEPQLNTGALPKLQNIFLKEENFQYSHAQADVITAD